MQVAVSRLVGLRSAIKFREGKGGPVEKQTARGKCAKKTRSTSTRTIAETTTMQLVYKRNTSERSRF
jgi:hypothetical protein